MKRIFIKHYVTEKQSVFKLLVNAILKKRLMLLALIFIIIALPIVYLTLKYQSPTQAAWYDDTFAYRQRVDITNTGTTQTDFQVAITLNTSALIAAGKMQSDCDDIRITDVNGKVLAHWIEENNPGCNQTTTKIWTKVPAISTTGTTVFLYYGNGSVSNVENPTQVFVFYDNFSSDLSRWSIPAGCTSVISLGVLQISASTGCDSTPMFVTSLTQSDVSGYAMDFRGKFSSGGSGRLQTYQRYRSTNSHMARFWITGTVTYYQEANPGFGTNTNVGNSNMAADTWYNLSAKVVGTNNTWTVNGTTIGSNVTTAATLTTQTDLTIGLGQYQTIVQYDNVRVRKSTATEPTVGSPTNEEKSQGPIAYWKFDEGQGITTNNSGNGGSTLNGTITNATWQTEDQCINGKCLYFNGSSGYVQVPISTPLKPTTALTISFWMKMTATQAGWQTIIGNSPYSSGYLVFMETGGAYLRYLVNINSTEYRLNSTFTPALNTWYHVTYVVDPANITMTSYINGKYDTSTGIPNGTITHNNNPLSFAQGGANYFKGYMDEPKIYPYARTAAQIKSDYNSQGTVKDSSVQIGSKNPRESFSHGLVGYWKLEETVSPAIDSSGNGNSGVWNGSPSSISGKFGFGISLNGTSGYINAGTSSTLGSTSITVATWFKQSGAIPDTYYGCLVSRNDGNGYHDNYNLYIDKTTNILSSRVGFGGTTLKTVTGTTNVNDGAWHHAVTTISFDGTNTLITLYLDGKIEGQDTQVGTPYTSGLTTYLSRFSSQYFPGTMDDIRIYNRALSPKEVRDLYAWAPGPIAYYDLNEGTGTTLNDKSGNGYNSTGFTGSPTWSQGKFGKALYFNGSSAVSLPATIFAKKPKQITFELWLKGEGQPTSSSIFQAGPSQKINVHAPWNNSNIYWDYGEACCNGRISKTMDAGYMNSNWTHFAFTADMDTNFMQIYANGTLWHSGTITANTMTNAPTNFTLGAYDTTQLYYRGWLDDFKVYDYVRTSKQIVEDMNAGHPAGGSPVGSQVGYWKFDEGYGINANDSSSQNNTLSITNATWQNAGKFGKALNFDGTGDFATKTDTNNAHDLTTGAITFWAKLNDNYRSIAVTKGDTESNPVTNYYVGTGSASKWLCGIGNGTTQQDLIDTNTAATNVWTYVACTFDGNRFRLYINGVIVDDDAQTITPQTNNGGLQIGRWGTGATYEFNGLLDEVKVYNSALTEDEIKLDYNHGSAMVLGESVEDKNDNPVGYWKLDENSGTTVNNYGSCSNCNGASASITYANGKINGSYDMQPSSADYWYVPANATLDVDSKFTVEAWATYDTASRYGLFANNTVENQFNPYISGTTVAVMGTTLSGGTITAGQWFHTAVTYDGTSYRLYVNGALVSTDSTTPARDFSGCWVFGQEVDGAGLCSSGFDSSQAWDGKIDEVKIYNYARSASQIKADAATDTLNPSLPGAPIAEWKLDENTGTTAYDTSGNNRNLSFGNTPTWTLGKKGSALDFDRGDYAYQDWADFTLSTQTIEFWVKADSLTGGWEDLVGTTLGNDLNRFHFYSGTSAISFYNIHGSCGSLSSGVVPVVGQWYHVAGVTDGTNAIIYINGQRKSSAACTGSHTSTGVYLAGPSGETFDGQIDDVKIYDYARTPAQIAYDYNRGGPVGHWKMDECQGNTLNDASGNANNGTLTIGALGSQTAIGTCTTAGTAWGNGATGKYNSSLNFDGSDDYVDVPNPTVINNNIQQITMSAWVKTTDTGYNHILSRGTSWTAGNTILYTDGSTEYRFTVYGYTSPAQSGVAPSGNWQHVVGVYDGTQTSNNMKIYVDGVLKGTGTANLGTLANRTDSFRIANRNDSLLSGQIDDVKIFNYALTAEQIKNLYNQGGAVRFGPVTGTP